MNTDPIFDIDDIPNCSMADASSIVDIGVERRV